MNSRTVTIALVVILAVATVAGAVLAMQQDGHDGTDYTDSRGRTVTVQGEIESIVCVNCCSLELVSYFDSMDKVIAMDSKDEISLDKTYTQVYADFLNGLPRIDTSDAERMIALGPSLIITSTTDPSAVDTLQRTVGIPVYAIDADLEFGDGRWFDQIEGLGAILGEKERAKQINDGIRDVISGISKVPVTGVNGYACGMMFYGAGNFLKTTGDFLPFDWCGIDNVMPTTKAGNKQPYNTTIEEVLTKDIDVIFIDNSNLAETVAKMKGFIDTTTLGGKDAIVNGEIHTLLTYKKWGTQFDAVLINALYAAKAVGGDACAWDFEAEADGILALLYGPGSVTYKDVDAMQRGMHGAACGKLPI